MMESNKQNFDSRKISEEEDNFDSEKSDSKDNGSMQINFHESFKNNNLFLLKNNIGKRDNNINDIDNNKNNMTNNIRSIRQNNYLNYNLNNNNIDNNNNCPIINNLKDHINTNKIKNDSNNNINNISDNNNIKNSVNCIGSNTPDINKDEFDSSSEDDDEDFDVFNEDKSKKIKDLRDLNASEMLTKGEDLNLFDDDDENENEIEKKGMLKTFMDSLVNNQNFMRTIGFISFIFSLTIFITYIVLTYFPYADLFWFNVFNVIVATYFNIETILHLYIAQRRLDYILNISGFVFLYTSIYPYLFFIKSRLNQQFLEFSHVCNIFRISYFVTKNIKINENDVVKFIIGMVQLFTVTILVFACGFRIVEIGEIDKLLIHPDTRYYHIQLQTRFHDFLYYIVVTIATVGYGDIYPVSEAGRVVIICLVIYAAYLIPEKTGELLKIFVNSNVYSREIFKALPEVPHIVVLGDVDVEALVSFCEELFHEDHGQSEKIVVILNSREPTPELRLFLHAGKFETSLRYLQGNPMSERDLNRTDLAHAEAIVILTDKYTSNANPTDHKNVLLALSIKKYLLKLNIPESTLYLQLIRPANRVNYLRGVKALSPRRHVSRDRIVILEEIKMNLLSKSCLLPGIIPFITNLVSSSGGHGEAVEAWLNEYLDGMDQEIYREELNSSLRGRTFAEISRIVFAKFDALAFALEIETDGRTHIALNPGGFFISHDEGERDDVKFFIYLICADKEVAQRVGRADNDKKEDGEEDREESDEDKEDRAEIGEIEEKKKEEKEKSKLGEYMRLKLKDLDLLEDNKSNWDIKDKEEELYYIKSGKKKSNKNEVIKESIRNSSSIRGHIIVCGTHDSMYYFLRPLRSKFLHPNQLKHIVILTKSVPSELWDGILRFDKITVINGSPLVKEDLLRANVEFASRVVILSNEASRGLPTSDKIVDAWRVFVHRAIKCLVPDLTVMTEFVFGESVEYLLPSKELAELANSCADFRLSSVFAAGEVFVNSVVDSLTAQAFYNKHIATIVQKMLTGGEGVGGATLGRIYDEVGLKSANFLQVEVPEKFINKTFGDLYEDLSSHNLIPLALYRLPGARDNDAPYVYTKPQASTKMSHRDRIFILGTEKDLAYVYEEAKNVQIPDEENSKLIYENISDDGINGEDFHMGEDVVYKENYLFTHFKNKLYEIEEQVENLNRIFEATTKSIKQSVSTGVKQEIASLLDFN